MAEMIWVDVEKCLGCGACVEACPAGLIDLVAGKASIAQQGCDGCLKCFEACANGALSVVVEPEPVALALVSLPRVPAEAEPPREKSGELGRWVAGALVLLTEEFGPRLARALFRALERREAASSLTGRAGSLPVDAVLPSVGGMRRRRLRRRGSAVSAAGSATRKREGG